MRPTELAGPSDADGAQLDVPVDLQDVDVLDWSEAVLEGVHLLPIHHDSEQVVVADQCQLKETKGSKLVFLTAKGVSERSTKNFLVIKNINATFFFFCVSRIVSTKQNSYRNAEKKSKRTKWMTF